MAAITTPGTIRAYYENTYQDETVGSVSATGRDPKGFYLIFDRTIFHPTGGGQPSDKGTLTINEKEHPVISLEESRESDRDTRTIRHYIKDSEGFSVEKGQLVKQKIDLTTRLMYARLHSAGHLLANVVELIDPKLDGYAGHHVPGEARVVFKPKEGESGVAAAEKSKAEPKPKKGKKVPDEKPALSKEIVEARIKAEIASKRAMVTNNATRPRTVQIEGFKAYPCGGTHLRNIAEIGSFTIRKIQNQKGEIRIGYDIGEAPAAKAEFKAAPAAPEAPVEFKENDDS